MRAREWYWTSTALAVGIAAGCDQSFQFGGQSTSRHQPVSKVVDVDEPMTPVERDTTHSTVSSEPAAADPAEGDIRHYVERVSSNPPGEASAAASAPSAAPAEYGNAVATSVQPIPAPALRTPIQNPTAGQQPALQPVAPSDSAPALIQQPAPLPVQNDPQPSGPVQPAAPVQDAPTHVAPAPPANEPARIGASTEVGSPVQPSSPSASPSGSDLKVEILDVMPAAMMPTKSPEPGTSANQAVAPSSAAGPADSLSGLIHRLEESVKANPDQLDDVYRLALLYLATDQEDKAGETVRQAEPMHGELLGALIQSVRQSRAIMTEPGAPASSALIAADQLRSLVAQRAGVMISKMALVTAVRSFGAYDPVDPAHFAAGRPVHVFLYTEIANFRSEPTDNGMLRTVLSETVEIFDANGNVIWRQNYPKIEDVVKTPRHDFFVPVEIRLPADTPAGEYIVKATIEDKISVTTDQRRMTFTIAAQ